MKDSNNDPVCVRASDLIAYLYNESDERETRDFELHLQECSECCAEVASFGVVRESITAWRDEALAGFVATPVTMQASRKSALTALRQFFDLSPLWLKGATALAAVALCVLAGLAFVNRNDDAAISKTENKPDVTYTAQDVERLVKEALAKQSPAPQPVAPTAGTLVKTETPKPKASRGSRSSQFAKSRRPLSQAEREQLAADLRLLSPREELNLLGDRMKQE
jgi:anti-sigma factor RsiW